MSGTSSSGTSSIARDVAGGVLKGVGGRFGALIVDAIFGSPPDFKVDYERIQKLVGEELVDNRVTEAAAQLNSIIQWVKNTYKPRKTSNADKKDLLDSLKRQEEKAVDLLGMLKADDAAMVGFPVYLMGFGVHIALLQEMAMVDPNAATPRDSSYLESVRRYTDDALDYAPATYRAIRTHRCAQIKSKQYTGFVAVKDHTTDEVVATRFFGPEQQKQASDWAADQVAVFREAAGLLFDRKGRHERWRETWELWPRLLRTPIPDGAIA